MKFKIQHVEYMPNRLEAGILYYSTEFETAAHLCACGCGAKIRTPIAPTEWSIGHGPNGPTLKPSIGNWQQPCQSHYFITDGKIVWANRWSTSQIEAGRRSEEKRRVRYYRAQQLKQRSGIFNSILIWLRQLFKN